MRWLRKRVLPAEADPHGWVGDRSEAPPRRTNEVGSRRWKSVPDGQRMCRAVAQVGVVICKKIIRSVRVSEGTNPYNGKCVLIIFRK